ncbi:MAG TPA: hypothetical protein VF595_00485 [Tepidisphaeraceae bacterium]
MSDDAQNAANLPYTMVQLKALVANGRDLTLHELRVMLSLVIRADEHGACYPSNEIIGKPWGMTEGNVRAAIRKLKTASASRPALIESTGVGGVSRSGKGISALRRVLLSDIRTRPESSRLESSRLESNPARKGSRTRPESSREPGQNLASKETIEETNKEIDDDSASQNHHRSVALQRPRPAVAAAGVRVADDAHRSTVKPWQELTHREKCELTLRDNEAKYAAFRPVVDRYPIRTVGRQTLIWAMRAAGQAAEAKHEEEGFATIDAAAEWLLLQVDGFSEMYQTHGGRRGSDVAIPSCTDWMQAGYWRYPPEALIKRFWPSRAVQA